jgi:hypothetical protein
MFVDIAEKQIYTFIQREIIELVNWSGAAAMGISSFAAPFFNAGSSLFCP